MTSLHPSLKRQLEPDEDFTREQTAEHRIADCSNIAAAAAANAAYDDSATAAQNTKRARTRVDSATTALQDTRNDEIAAFEAEAARNAARGESDDAPLAWLLGLEDSPPSSYHDATPEHGGVIVCECGLIHDDVGSGDGDNDDNDDGGSDDKGNDDSDGDNANGGANGSGNADTDAGTPRSEY
jgi:hypothetical protein